MESLLKIMNCFFVRYIETETNRIEPQQLDLLEKNLEAMFIYCATWSVGCTTDYDGRSKFNAFFKQLMAEHGFILNSSCKFSIPGSIYDCNFDQEKSLFYFWTEEIKDFSIEKNAQYSEIMVPTADSQRNIFLMKLLLSNSYNVLCMGPTGTGKSQNGYDLLQTKVA